MSMRKLTLVGAALAGVMLAGSAAADENVNTTMPRAGNRAVMSPPATARTPEGTVVRDVAPTSPNESKALPIREPQDPVARGDNPNLPNPVTPSAANESAPQPKSLNNEPTNQPGIPRYPTGGTR
jgi:hypothetical protein